MMGRLKHEQEQLFYEFRLVKHAVGGHLTPAPRVALDARGRAKPWPESLDATRAVVRLDRRCRRCDYGSGGGDQRLHGADGGIFSDAAVPVQRGGEFRRDGNQAEAAAVPQATTTAGRAAAPATGPVRRRAVRRGKAYRRGGKSRGIQSGGAAPSAIDQPIPAHATGGGSPKSASLSARATRCSADNCSHRAASSSSARSATSGLSRIEALCRSR
jgi:hypothetical protein